MGNEKLTVVFGYSGNPDRYSFMAYQLLREKDKEVFAFNPRLDDFNIIPKSFHTLTLYVSPEISHKFLDKILELNFERIIFNPGTENQALEERCREKKREIIHGCTLVMLNTNQYE